MLLDALAVRMEFDVSLPDPVTQYRRRVETHPAVVTELDGYPPKLAAFLDG